MSIFNKVLEALSKNDIRFVVVGGFAAVLHGNNRLTSDLDLAIDDLIKMKEISAREQDKLDIQNLKLLKSIND